MVDAIVASAGGAVLGVILAIAVYVIACLPLWGIFNKARAPGWAAFVPFYNIYTLLKVVGRPGWWLVFYFIPIVNIIITIVVMYDLSQSFGHGVGFTVGLVVLSWIFMLILWVGSSAYRGPAASPQGGSAAY